MAMRRAAGEGIRVFCILDADFHPADQILERQQQALGSGIELHIWSKKELENYLLVPAVRARVIRSRAAPGKHVSATDIAEKLREITAALRDGVHDALAAEFFSLDRAAGFTGANKRAREFHAGRLATGATELDLVSGKEVLSRLSAWAQNKWGASVGPKRGC